MGVGLESGCGLGRVGMAIGEWVGFRRGGVSGWGHMRVGVALGECHKESCRDLGASKALG